MNWTMRHDNVCQQAVVTVQAGKAELLKRLSAKLKEWTPLLQRFLKSEDEQVSTNASLHMSHLACKQRVMWHDLCRLDLCTVIQ